MDAVAAFALGVFIGLIIYWVVYRMYWHRWRKYQERDITYLRSKVESAEFTSLGLERQVAAQKAEMAGQQTRITGLEREIWQAQMLLADMAGEKQALVAHLGALRAELAAYKKAVSGPDMPAPAQPQGGNGKTHEPSPASHLPAQDLPPRPAARAADSNKDGPDAAPQAIKPYNGKMHTYAPPEQVLEPVLMIRRPRMGGDRLDIIPGIGPAIVKRLNRAGIDTFQALSQLTAGQLIEVVGPRAAKSLDAASVISQARKLASGRRSRRGAG